MPHGMANDANAQAYNAMADNADALVNNAQAYNAMADNVNAHPPLADAREENDDPETTSNRPDDRLNFKDKVMYPRSLSINYLKEDCHLLRLSDLKDAYVRQDRQLVKDKPLYFPASFHDA